MYKIERILGYFSEHKKIRTISVLCMKWCVLESLILLRPEIKESEVLWRWCSMPVRKTSNKQKHNQPSKKRKGPNLNPETNIRNRKNICTVLCCCGQSGICWCCNAIWSFGLGSFSLFSLSHFPKFPQKQIYGTGISSLSWYLSD